MTEHHGEPGTRNQAADLIKGLAVIFMIQVHIMEQFATPDTYNSVAGKISLFLGGPFCAPVFMAVMGYYLAVSRRPAIYFLKRGLVLFLGGIALNTARSANLLFQVFSGRMELDPWLYILGVDILPLAGLSLWLIALLKPVFKNHGLLYLVAAVAIAAVSPLLAGDPSGTDGIDLILAFFCGNGWWSYFPLFPWASYVLAGYAFRLVVHQFPSLYKLFETHQLAWLIAAWLLILATVPYAAPVTCQLDGAGGYYHHGFLLFAWLLLFLAGYVPVIRMIAQIYGTSPIVRLISWAGRKVTLLYVIQWIIIGNLATLIYRSQDLFEVTGWTILVGLVTFSAANLVRTKGVRRPG